MATKGKKKQKSGNPDDPNYEIGYVTDEGNTDDEYFSDTDGEDSEGRKKALRIKMYCKHTHYEVVKEAGKVFAEFHLTKKEFSDWDLAWFDGPSPGYLIDLIKKMHNHQRTNHFPGIYNLARKNMLGRHLMKMKKLIPQDYNFFPTTYMLPHDYNDFREDSKNSKYAITYIVKPEDSCQGKGIYLTRNWDSIKQTDQMVVQKYMQKPHLIDGFKYDLRIYVLINGINPLRIYVYKDGLARFATTPYVKPTDKNIDNLFMHLTNYAINKESDNYVQNEGGPSGEYGSKRSYQSVIDMIESNFGTPAAEMLQKGINDIIIKSICMVQPHVNHLVRSCQPDDIENQMIFQILGFDVMLDSKLRPSLIEINQMPSFATDSSLDYRIKRGLITDVLKTLCLNMGRRNRYKKERRQKMTERLMVKPSFKKPEDDKDNDKKDENENNKEQQSGQKNKEQQQSKQNQQQAKDKYNSSGTNPEGLSQKQMERLAKQEAIKKEKQKRSILREKNEASVCNDLVLIYPIVQYDHEYKIEALYPICEKRLREDINNKRGEALKQANGNRFNIDFDVQRDVYDKITNKEKVKNYCYELDTHTFNSKGERQDEEDKSPEQLADFTFKNHVYELVFQDLKKQLKEEFKQKLAQQAADAKLKAQQAAKAKLQPKKVVIKQKKKIVDEYGEEIEEEEGDDDYDDEKEEDEVEEEEEDLEEELVAQNYDLRDDWIGQTRYVKYMEQANFLWDQFTSGNTQQKLKKIREQEELEEKLRKEEKEKKAQQRALNQKKMREAVKDRQNKEEQFYQMFKAEMEEEEESGESESETHDYKPKTQTKAQPKSKTKIKIDKNSYLSDKDNEEFSSPGVRSTLQGSYKKDLQATNTFSPQRAKMQQTTMNLSMNNYAFSNNNFSQTQKNQNYSQVSDSRTKESIDGTPSRSPYNLPQLSSPLKLKREMDGISVGMGTNSYGNQTRISHYQQGPTIKKLKHVDYYKHMKEKYQMKRALAEQEQQQIQSILAKQTQNLQLDIIMRQTDFQHIQSKTQKNLSQGGRSITQTGHNTKGISKSRLQQQQMAQQQAQGLGAMIVRKGRNKQSIQSEMASLNTQTNTQMTPINSRANYIMSSSSAVIQDPKSPQTTPPNKLPMLQYSNESYQQSLRGKRATIAGTSVQTRQPHLQNHLSSDKYGLTLTHFELLEKNSNKFKSPIVKSNLTKLDKDQPLLIQPQSMRLQDFATIYGKNAFKQNKSTR